MTTIQEAIQEYLLAKQADGISQKSVAWYEWFLQRWATWMEQHDITQIGDVTTQHLRQYIVHEQSLVATATVESVKRALNAFFVFCTDEIKDVDISPMSRIKRVNPRKIAKKIKSISFETFKALIEFTYSYPEGDHAYAIRDRAMLLVLADTGVRAGGLVGLRVSDVDMKRRQLITYEKGDKARSIPFKELTKKALEEWLAVRPQSDWFFCALRSNHGVGSSISPTGLYHRLRWIAKHANVKESVSPHRIRHMFASEYMKNGGSLHSLAILMGHSNIEITSGFYVNYSDNDLKEAHQRFSPISDMEE